MGLISFVTNKALDNGNQWAADHSVEIYNQTTGPQLQQIVYHDMPNILSKVSDWLDGMMQSWQFRTGLATFASVMLLIIFIGILCFIWLYKIHSTQRRMYNSVPRCSNV